MARCAADARATGHAASHTRATARLELPVYPAHDTIALYRATGHHRPTFNGYSGYFAPHYWALQYLLEQHDPAVLTRLSALARSRS